MHSKLIFQLTLMTFFLYSLQGSSFQVESQERHVDGMRGKSRKKASPYFNDVFEV